MKGVSADVVEQLAEMLDRSLAAWLVSNSPLPFADEVEDSIPGCSKIKIRQALSRSRYPIGTLGV